MSGFLYTLRQQWRQTIGNPQRTMETPSAAFIGLFGKTATFQHVGVDCDHLGRRGSRNYHGQVYAVFTTRKGSGPCPLTPLDLESLASTLQNLPAHYQDRAAILAHLQPQIAKATQELAGHRKTLAWLNPQAAQNRQIA